MEEIVASSKEKRSQRRCPPPPRACPWLVFPHRKYMKEHAFYNLCEPKNRTCRKFIPEMSLKSYWQKPSHQGWFVMVCDNDDYVDAYSNSNCNLGDCFLWNPVSLETIQLPNLLYWFNNHYYIRDCVLSSPPITNHPPHNDAGPVVFILFEQLFADSTFEQVLLFCRLGEEEKQWRTRDLSEYLVNEDGCQVHLVSSLLSFKEKIYGLCINTKHLEIQIKLGHHNDDTHDDETVSIRSFMISNNTFFPSVGGSFPTVGIHYLECCDELFMIYKNYHKRTKNMLTSIQILRLDFSLMSWEKVKSLGDHVLFLGQNTIACCSAAELGLKRGCLYFTMRQDQSLYKFNVEDNDITVTLPCLKLPTPWFLADWIMMPTTINRVADGRRTTEDGFNKEKEEGIFVEVEENKASITLNDEKDSKGEKHKRGQSLRTLNEDILTLIASYLHPVDYIHFRSVCQENRSMIPAAYRRSFSNGFIKTTCLSPWLVSCTNNDTMYNFVDPMHNNEKYLMNLSEVLIGATIRFSKSGWLLMSKGEDTIFFYNPFTRTTIKLPNLPRTYSFVGMSFSSLPTSPDCIVFGIEQLLRNRITIFVIARGDQIWRSHTFYENTDLQKYMPCFNNPVFYEGAFYCLDYNGTLGVFELENGLWKVLEEPQGKFNALYPSFLVACDGKLLSVNLGPLGKSVRICKLDLPKKAWVEVQSLGKHMLFISNTSCLSAIAPHRSMENKIYFARLLGEEILFYSLDTGSYHSLGNQHSVKDLYDTTERLNCTWIEPNWLQTTDQELYWHSI